MLVPVDPLVLRHPLPHHRRPVMPNTAQQRTVAALRDLGQFETTLREAIHHEELLLRRAVTQSRTTVSKAVAAVQQRLRAADADCETQAAASASGQAGGESLFVTRRELAQLRRANKGEGRTSKKAPPGNNTSGAALAASSQEEEVRRYEVRCLEVERGQLLHQYRSEWVQILSQHRRMVENVSMAAVPNTPDVIVIQRTFRMHREVQRYQSVLGWIRLIQRCGRGFLVCRKRAARQLQIVRAEQLLQRVFNAYRTRWTVGRVQFLPIAAERQRQQAATRIQATYRSFAQSRSFWELRRRSRASVVIQRRVREWLALRLRVRLARQFDDTMRFLESGEGLLQVRSSERLHRQHLQMLEHECWTGWTEIMKGFVGVTARRHWAQWCLQEQRTPPLLAGAGVLAPSAVHTASLAGLLVRPLPKGSLLPSTKADEDHHTTRTRRCLLQQIKLMEDEALERCAVLLAEQSMASFFALEVVVARRS